MITIMSKSIERLFENAAETHLEPGANLFRAGDRVRSMFLVNAGQIDLVRHSEAGTQLILARAGPGDVVAEASAYSNVYHCDGTVRLHSTLLMVPVRQFRQSLNESSDLSEAWSAYLARGLQASRMLSQVRTLKTVAQRLDAWLLDNAEVPNKGQIQDLAHLLGVSREALYRELAKRRG